MNCFVFAHCLVGAPVLQMIYIFVFLLNILHMRHTHRKINKREEGGKAGGENRFFLSAFRIKS